MDDIEKQAAEFTPAEMEQFTGKTVAEMWAAIHAAPNGGPNVWGPALGIDPAKACLFALVLFADMEKSVDRVRLEMGAARRCNVCGRIERPGCHVPEGDD